MALLLLTLVGGCSDEGAITDPDKLCARGAGVAARIAGTPQPVDVCVPNDQTSTTYAAPPANRYDLAATTTEGGVQFSIDISFQVHRNQPQELNITSEAPRAFSDPDGAWFFYREVQPGVYDYSASSVTGVFTLTISDESVAVGTFTDVQIELEDTADGTPVGSRLISEGFFSVTPD
jgi:hypothetical protein